MHQNLYQLLPIFAAVTLSFKRRFPAKLLWFGEYTVVEGGDALAGPLPNYYGHWVSGPSNLETSLIDFLQGLQLNGKIKKDAFQTLLETSYLANVPQGKGLGSSGALSAALYDLISDHKSLPLDQKRFDLGQIEAYWHGKGSGFDALVSLQNTILWRQTGKITAVEPKGSLLYFYLLDSRRPRKTRVLIDLFRQMLDQRYFRDLLATASEVVSDIIARILQGDPIDEQVAELSVFQYEHMRDFIPEFLHQVWHKTLDQPNLHLKLCGAGGGGYYYLISGEEIPNLEWQGFQLTRVSLDV